MQWRNNHRLFPKTNEFPLKKCFSPGTDSQITNILKLGKFDTDGTLPRSMKTTLRIPEEFNIQTNLSFDKTPKQLQYQKELKLELEERKNNGETNIKVKHFNGSPKRVNFQVLQPVTLFHVTIQTYVDLTVSEF